MKWLLVWFTLFQSFQEGGVTMQYVPFTTYAACDYAKTMITEELEKIVPYDVLRDRQLSHTLLCLPDTLPVS